MDQQGSPLNTPVKKEKGQKELLLFQSAWSTLVSQVRQPIESLFNWIQEKTTKKKSHLLQLIKPKRVDDDPRVYGTLVITPLEARLGTRKILSIPSGSKKRLLKVTVPPSTRDGRILRLSGAGVKLGDGTRQDIYLRIKVAERN